EEQRQRGSDDYSIATIGRLSAEHGGPSAAAIRNKPGEDYRALIKAYAESVKGRSRKVASKPRTEAEELLEGVTDPVLKVRIKLLLAEMESLRAQLLAARHLANQTAVLDLSAAEGGINKEAGSNLFLTLQEASALKAAVSPETLAHWGWKMDEAGRVTTETGQVVFRAGFGSAVSKTLTYVTDL
ncbi:MAG: hypothetical protein HYZ18_06955, partial [Pseudogulbenkiania sp.]|nr:hypothetical protein [Pseudogulbenkiania sp.]